MNKMKEFAALLGVELDEEFKLKRLKGIWDFSSTVFRITNDGLKYQCENDLWDFAEITQNILLGDFEIVKIHWKPKEGETIYFVTSAGIGRGELSSEFIGSLALYVIGNCFKTKEEAEDDVDKIREKLKKMYDDGVQI